MTTPSISDAPAPVLYFDHLCVSVNPHGTGMLGTGCALLAGTMPAHAAMDHSLFTRMAAMQFAVMDSQAPSVK